jgi:hypothetical protein
VVRIERQLGQVDVLAGELDGVDGSISRRHLDNLLRVGEPPEVFVVDFFLGGVERGEEALPAGSGLGDDLGSLRAGLLEQHRLVGALDHGAERGQRHGFIMDFDLAHVD